MVGIKVFLLFLHDDRRIWIRIQSRIRIRIPLTSADPDPQHCPPVQLLLLYLSLLDAAGQMFDSQVV